jgi:hypothetical protein
MIVVDKVSYSIHCVEPRAVWVLALQHEIQISFGDFPIVFVGKKLGGARQQKGAIGGSINDPAFIERRVGTTAGTFRRSEILNISSGLSGNRFDDYFPFFLSSQFENLEESFVTVGSRRNERRLFFDCAVTGDPIKGITLAIFLEARAARFFELG